MRRVVSPLLTAALLVFAGASEVSAWSANGRIVCDSNQNGVIDSTDAPIAGARVVVRSADGSFVEEGVSDATGFWITSLLEIEIEYTATLVVGSLPAGSVVLSPAGGVATFSPGTSVSFLVQNPQCAGKEGRCWLTGGGAKFSPVTGTPVAEHGPQHSFGGNVNPGCNPDSGEGGQWNHVAHGMKLHFQGWQIRVVRCGNVEDLPPGSESPVTPFNFIEFEGTGTLKGIHGNKVNHGTVQFFARAEDRNEPGSSGSRDGARVDRYFLHVWNPSGTLMLIENPAGDGNAATVEPVTITDGNLQIHISSCEPTSQP